MTFQLCPWWLAASPACWDELEDSPFKCREQYPRGKKEFLPRSGQGRGCCVAPPVAVEAETNTENAFSDVSPRRKMLGGLIYFCGSAERDWIAVTNLGQLEWSLWPKDLSPSYKFNFCLWWLTVQNNTQQKEDKKRGRKLKCPCLHALLKCHDPRLAPLIPPVSLSDDEMMMGGGGRKGSNYNYNSDHILPLHDVKTCIHLGFGSYWCLSPPACWGSGPAGKHFSPLPRKHVCIPSMLPCFCLYDNLSPDLPI